MATTQRNSVLGHIHKLVDQASLQDASDLQLVGAFAAGGGEAAFAALLRRHGPLVLGVCRRILRNEHDAEDVFQATFLLLARRAGSIRKQESVGSWLHGVAHRLAVRVKSQSARRQAREQQAATMRQKTPKLAAAWGELQEALDDTLCSLPEKYRAALLLCYLEGRTQEEAAVHLGCPLGTVRSRLAQGRKLLRERLARRGLAPSAGAVAALLAGGGVASAVPPALHRQTLRAAVQTAAGQAASLVSARVADLISGGHQAMFGTRIKIATSLLVLCGLLTLGAGTLPRPLGAEPPREGATQATGPTAPAAKPAGVKPRPAVGEAPPAKAAEATTMIVTGQVRDVQGRPVAQAAVAVLGWRNSPWRSGDLTPDRQDVLGQTKTDAQGGFRLQVQRTDSVRFLHVQAVAAAPGHALGWRDFDPDADQPQASIQLPAETVIHGRLVDLQGQPAAGVKVLVTGFGKDVRGEPRGISWGEAPERLPLWPQPVTTDAQGRYVLHGVNRQAGVRLAVRDPRFAPQSLFVRTKEKEGDNETAVPLTPAQIVEGRVTYADTGKPAAHARVFCSVDPSVRDDAGGIHAIGGTGWYGVRTDEQGRFRLNPGRGKGYLVTAYSASGEPYLTVRKQLLWPKGAVKAQIDIALPRGVLVRGKVTESPSGKPVAGAGIYYQPMVTNPNERDGLVTQGTDGGVLTGSDGTFQIPVPPGAGHLLVSGPTLDYIRLEIDGNKLYNGRAGGRRAYPHGLVPLDPRPGSAPLDVTVTLRRGVSVAGRLVGPDGQPVQEALLFCRLNGWPWFIDYHPHLSHRHVQGGRFELHGLDPEKTYPVYILDPRNKVGATVKISGKQAGGKPLVVRLAPCGSATLRVLDTDGKPWVKYAPPVEFVITPGVSTHLMVVQGDPVVADAESLINLDRLNYWNLRTGADGRVALPALIPGATYRVMQFTGDEWVGAHDFTVGPGENRQLPDLIIKRTK
jgi:RNA polymerase sigma factor (sigma-70 family)